MLKKRECVIAETEKLRTTHEISGAVLINTNPDANEVEYQ